MSSVEPPSRTARLLDLLAFVATRRFPVSGAQIMEGVPAYRDRWVDGTRTDRTSVKRMFERDKTALKELGVPLETRRGARPGGDEELCYQIRVSAFHLPRLGPPEAKQTGGGSAGDTPAGEVDLSAREMRLAVEGLQHVLELPSFPLRRPARSALRKLTFDLAPELEEGALAVHHLPPAGPDPSDDTVQAVARAVLARRVLRFDYYSIGADRRARRRVEPRGLLYQGSHWYLVAWDREREDERLFRVDRMETPVPEGGTDGEPQFEIPEGYSLDHVRERAPWELGDDRALVVTVHFQWPRSLLAARNGWGELVEDRGREGAERTFRVQAPNPLLRWVLAQPGEARITAPESMARRLETMRRRTLELHS